LKAWIVKKTFTYAMPGKAYVMHFNLNDEFPYDCNNPVDLFLKENKFIEYGNVTKFKNGEWVRHVSGDIFKIDDIDDSTENERYYGDNLYNTRRFECPLKDIECRMRLTVLWVNVFKHKEYVDYRWSTDDPYKTEQEAKDRGFGSVATLPLYVFEEDNE
jgi:hypothetical protein